MNETGHPPHGQPSEEELRAALEEELKKVKVTDVLLQTLVTLINVAGQRLGLVEGTQESRDLGQVRVAIEAVRQLLPLLEEDEQSARQVRPIRDALSQLQLAYAREVGAGEGEAPPSAPEGAPEAPGAPPGKPPPPKRPSGLWVPRGSGE
jgi:hypothetical protein